MGSSVVWAGVGQCRVMGEGRGDMKGGVLCVLCVVCVLCKTIMGVEEGWLGRYSLFV